MVVGLLLPIVASAGEVTLEWDASPGTPQPLGYRVYYGLSSHAYTDNIDAGNQTFATVSGLAPEENYYFAVAAYSAIRESGFSNEVSAAIGAPNRGLVIVSF